MDNYNAFLDDVYAMPHDSAKIPFVEEAIRLADQYNDEENAYKLRMGLIHLGIFFGQPLKALPAFAWCLAAAQKDSTKYDMDTLLWRYKWICGNITSFPEFSLKQIEELHEDYGRLLKEYGYTQYAYWYRMMRFGMTTYNKELAKEAHDRLLKERKDDMADCKACVQHGFTCYAVFMDDYPLAMGYATPILEGKMKCREIPHYTYGELILPLYKAGELKKAAEMEQKGYRLIHDNIEYLGSMGNYLLYYSLRDTGKGIDRYQRHVHWSFDRFTSYNSRFCYAHGSYSLFKKSAESGISELKMRLPAEHPLYKADGSYHTQDLADYHYQIASEMAMQFDRRNGNSGYMDELNTAY